MSDLTRVDMPGLDYVHEVHTPDSTSIFPIRYLSTARLGSARPGSDWLQPGIEAGLICDDVSAACIPHMQTTFQEGARLARPALRSRILASFVFP
jgi:hypothetical protein